MAYKRSKAVGIIFLLLTQTHEFNIKKTTTGTAYSNTSSAIFYRVFYHFAYCSVTEMTHFYLSLRKYIQANVWAICLQALAFTSAHSAQVNLCLVFVYQAISDSQYLCVFVCACVCGR